MAGEELIKCQNCGRTVVPRLWLTGGDFLTYKTTQHLCPYCGVVMYETGGTYKRRPTIIAVVFACIMLIATLIAVTWIYLIR
jgi:DNA-directed RNA polymerase subunit RPC12/RpoP